MEPTAALSTAPSMLEPPRYLRAVVDYLRSDESDLWTWFSSNNVIAGKADAARLELLKSTYRLERDSHAKLYAEAEAVRGRLGMTAPLTLYQAQGGQQSNAALAFLPGEAHVIFSGPLLLALSDAEMQALLGHELAHFRLWNEWDAMYLTAAELLAALSHDSQAGAAAVETARLFQLYTEVYADRGALRVTGDATAAISTLLKLATGLAEVSPENYLRQAEEIFSKSPERAAAWSHPEPYIRARALHLWSKDGAKAEDEIARMIEGPLALDRLDFLGQKRVSQLTRTLFDHLLTPDWFRCEPVLAHARLFFEDYLHTKPLSGPEALAKEIARGDTSLHDYFCYVMLDFVAVDRDITDNALAMALDVSDSLGLADKFRSIATKELGLTKKQWTKIGKNAPNHE